MAYMTIFSWLLIGHFVGDWMFQNDWMARDKRGRWWSSQCVIHCIVYTVIMLVFAWFGSGQSASATQLGILFSVTIITHWLIDGFNLAEIWGRVVNQTQSDFVRIVVDQTMHIFVLGVTATVVFG